MATIYTHINRNRWKTVVLITVFIAILLSLGYLYDRLYVGFGSTGLVVALTLSVVMTLASYFWGDRVALTASGAKGPIKKSDAPGLWNAVENLAITAGLPMPKVYLIPDPGLNAFATGRDPQHAKIAVTTGLLEQLENEELEGVLAHELSHVGNRDILVMTLVVVLVGSIALLSDFFLRSRWWGGRRDDRGGGQIGAILMIVGIVLAILSPFIAELIKLAVSRKREFLADASGSLLTRYPEGLARALEKIGQQSKLATVNHATAHLFIANPFGSRTRRTFLNLWSTHPPIEERITRLRGM